jgi:hypothetical protein
MSIKKSQSMSSWSNMIFPPVGMPSGNLIPAHQRLDVASCQIGFSSPWSACLSTDLQLGTEVAISSWLVPTGLNDCRVIQWRPTPLTSTELVNPSYGYRIRNSELVKKVQSRLFLPTERQWRGRMHRSVSWRSQVACPNMVLLNALLPLCRRIKKIPSW